ncbi:NUDIX domain-containing protein [Bacillus sp. FJAT-28004]|uniref:NUDIX domain-containing protein n=1 Tax=Bacillus sp. FJAT-28004 TaxID=1679165 RepID=UPI0006B449FC|nr:NUDIX hydrolase [Bacillus sp. FJAT-28004]
MSITSNKDGFELLACIAMKEDELRMDEPLAGSYAVIKCGERYLICFNKWRKQWEVPAGGREEGETPKECAMRELFEETSQIVNDLEFIGLIKVKRPNGEIKYNPIYYANVGEIIPFEANEETEKILLWDLIDDIGYMDEVDKEVLEWCKAISASG